jgi:hypothetical protein
LVDFNSMKEQQITLMRRWGCLHYKDNEWEYSMNIDSKKTAYESLTSLLGNEAPSWYDAGDLAKEERLIIQILKDKLDG